MENFKNKKLLTGLLLVSLVLIMVGVTFAAISFTGISDQNLIKSGKVSMSYTESSNVINITDALPVKDEIGKNSTEYFDFTIMSNADTNADDNEGIKIPYNLIIEPKAVDSDKDALTNDQIKVYLTKVEGGVETEVLAPTKISKLASVDSNFNLYSTENVHKNGNGAITTDYRLRAWIDYGVESKDWATTSKQKQYKFGVNVNATGEFNGATAFKKSGADTIIEKVGTDGLVKEDHPATSQLAATTDYRYTGANPNNYVSFNNELWRIIGVFDVDDGKGNIEKRIKIIRNESIGDIQWDYKASDRTYVNDWTKATGKALLNEGDYWNRTGDYASTGLTDEAKLMIADAKWYLGGSDQYYASSASNGLVRHFYGYERGTTVYTGRPTSWVGKVGLMYPSDYGYATSGGATTNRAACLAKELYNWNNSSVSDCKNNNWLYKSSSQWTITPTSPSTGQLFFVTSDGKVYGYEGAQVNKFYPLYPSIYLKSDIEIVGGTGIESDPYLFSGPGFPPTGDEKLGTDTIIEKVGTDGLVAESHPATEQLAATTDYRYTGNNPNNYIKFNDEFWRIIGVFDVDDGKGNIEKRIKIIKAINEGQLPGLADIASIGQIAWDENDRNDWTKATGMKLLNEGDYWNRTGKYATYGLTEEAKTMIGDAKWYLGGTNYYESSSNGLASHFYSYERGTRVYSDEYTTRPISWVGKVGLMYPSDYGYATSGGTATNREACLAKEIYSWGNSDAIDCCHNDWLLDAHTGQLTLAPLYGNERDVIIVSHEGDIYQAGAVSESGLRPSVYLKSDIKITGGTGKKSDPYTLSH